MIKYYLAPMEGLTGYVFRNSYHKYFDAFDKYFTPFISPTKKKVLKTRELRDVLPENNRGMYTVPQILTNNSENFIETVSFLKGLGYNEVNLNLGCPAPTVVTKHKGAGFLEDLEKLDEFFYEIFEKIDGTNVSVKTRIGLHNADEFEEILQVFCKYPICEIIVHPRVRNEYYKGVPNLDAFGKSFENLSGNICYNGDLFEVKNVENIVAKFPKVSAVMLGRGILKNPCLLEEINGKEAKIKKIFEFHKDLLEGYKNELSGDRDILFKMKEMWFYLGQMFSDGDNFENELKAIKKSQTVDEYCVATNKMFEGCIRNIYRG